MKKINLITGGFNAKLDDIMILQDNLLMLSKALAGGISGDYPEGIIMQGADVTISGGSISWTDGIVYISGELYPLSAGSLSYSSGNKYYFDVVSTDIMPRQKFTGSSAYHEQDRYVQVLSASSLPSGALSLTDGAKYSNIIMDNQWQIYTNVLPLIALENNPTLILVGQNPAQNSARLNKIAYRKKGKNIEMTFRIRCDFNPVTSATCEKGTITLPFGWQIVDNFPLNTTGRIFNSVTNNSQTAYFAQRGTADNEIDFYFETPINLNSGGTVELWMPLISAEIK